MLYMSPSKFYLGLFSGLVKEIVLCQLRDEYYQPNTSLHREIVLFCSSV